MHKLNEIILISMMANALRDLPQVELDSLSARKRAYQEMENEILKSLSGWSFAHLDMAATFAETARREILWSHSTKLQG